MEQNDLAITPHRCANDSSPKSPSYESLRQEYEAYKLKTKDWQGKVRERDATMRRQLQQSSDALNDKDNEVNELSKEVATLRKDLERKNCELVHLFEANSMIEKLKDELRETTERNAQLAAVAESQCAELLRMRTVHNELEVQSRSKIEELNRIISGEALVLGSIGGSNALRVVRRVSIGSTLFCFAVAGATAELESGQWIEENLLRGIMQRKQLSVEFPSTDDDAKVAELEDVVGRCEQRIRTESAQEIARISSAHADALALELDKIHKLSDALRAANDEKRRAEATLEEERSLHAQQVEEFHRLVLPNAINESRQRAETQLAAEMERLRSEIKALEDYKARAQLAMRASTNGDAKLEKLKSEHEAETQQWRVAAAELQERIASLEAEKEDALQRAVRRTEATNVQQDVRVLELERSLSSATETLLQRDEEVERLRGIIRAKEEEEDAKKLAVTASQEKTRLSLVEVGSQTSALPSVSPQQTPYEPTPYVVSPILPPRRPHAISDEFSFDEILHAIRTDGGAASNRHQGEAMERLKREHLQQSTMLAKMRDDLKDLTLREKHLLEQVHALKSQLRANELSATRDKELREHNDYLKNIVLKVLTSSDPAIKKALVPVLAEVLHLSPSEREVLKGVS